MVRLNIASRTLGLVTDSAKLGVSYCAGIIAEKVSSVMHDISMNRMQKQEDRIMQEAHRDAEKYMK